MNHECLLNICANSSNSYLYILLWTKLFDQMTEMPSLHNIPSSSLACMGPLLHVIPNLVFNKVLNASKNTFKKLSSHTCITFDNL